jgi:hypothetical protein
MSAAERKPIGLDVAWGQEPQVEADPPKQRAPRKRTPAAKKAAQEQEQEQAPALQLALLAADPVKFVEGMAAVKRGAARRALNLDVPGELGDWFTKWCRDAEVSQRDVMRALLQALRADVTQPAPPAAG